MGIEIPEEYGGAGGSFFNAILAVEEISAVDPSVGVMVDVQNTLCVNALVRWATDEQKKKYLPQLASGTDRFLCTERGGIGIRRLRAADARDEARRRLCAEWAEALDYECEGGGAVYRLCDARSSGRVQGDYGVSGGERHAGIYAWARRKTSSAFALRVRASLCFNDCVVPAAQVLGEPGKGYKIAIETLNEGRIGIGAQMLGLGRGSMGIMRRSGRRSASSLASRWLSFRRCSSNWRRWRRRLRRRG